LQKEPYLDRFSVVQNTTVNPKWINDPTKEQPNKQLICTNRFLENSKVKAFAPLRYERFVQAKPILATPYNVGSQKENQNPNLVGGESLHVGNANDKCTF